MCNLFQNERNLPLFLPVGALWSAGRRCKRRNNGEAAQDDSINTLHLGPSSGTKRNSKLLEFDQNKASNCCYIQRDHKANSLGILWCCIDTSLVSGHLMFLPACWYPSTFLQDTIPEVCLGEYPLRIFSPCSLEAFFSHYLQGCTVDPGLDNQVISFQLAIVMLQR